ncbi:MAG TPA: fumarylacetoacetate hydrolase family protein [Aliidongia sp.]|uniref:fumarylacetoacetate hydrolase family protein n=1 Tax=Aliidongia sp. TaxID=1914230 RepID=UPI002DDD31BE|nr:fumarylacetoacetate hydrolase family protein [Aliidongia sp.]HEV2675593.1 fumarylacetoacetate hydrolase family protein [Aliidongia sp.]
MKLLRYGPVGQEKPGMLDGEGKLRDLTGKVADIAGEALSPAGLAKLKALDPASLPLVAGSPRLGPCVGQVGKFVAVGLNYSDHAAETGAKVPEEPILFMKATSSIVGPNDTVVIPRNSKKTDWEVELAFVIGTKASYVSEADALKHVAGYCVVNDVSEREFQIERGGQWTKGKSADTFGPMGPWLVTPDEIADVQALDMFLDVSGKRCQTGTTKTMIFGVQFLVHYISQYMTLHPGDVITTGTPPGVGLGMKPAPWFLKPGDEMHLGIQGLGEQRQKVVASE